MIFFAWVAIVFFGTWYSGHALTVIWRWFLVPFGVPTITLFQALGIAMVVAYMTHQYVYAKDDRSPSEVLATTATYTFLKPTLALLFGWIILKLMGATA